MYSWREKAWDWGSECSDSLRAAWRREEPETTRLERGCKRGKGDRTMLYVFGAHVTW